MTLADRIRSFFVENELEPTRVEGKSRISIRVGELRSRMELPSGKNTNVWQALKAQKFLDSENLELKTDPCDTTGGGNTHLHFRLW